VKDRKGPVGKVGTIAAGLAAAARRRQNGREPRVVVYDAVGHGRLLGAADPAREPLLAAGRRLIELGLREDA
jgi:hypothetical protein